MPQNQKKGSLIGAVGATLVGAAMLLFIVTIILNSLKGVDTWPATGTGSDDWNASNDTIDQLLNFVTISAILLGVLGITMIGASIIGYISGAFM